VYSLYEPARVLERLHGSDQGLLRFFVVLPPLRLALAWVRKATLVATVYYGVFCATCGHFMRMGQHEGGLASAQRELGALPDKWQMQCVRCGDALLYEPLEIVFSAWPDGRAKLIS
jgi:hypothetical protein